MISDNKELADSLSKLSKKYVQNSLINHDLIEIKGISYIMPLKTEITELIWNGETYKVKEGKK
jgi:hypothetical protein